MPMNCLMPHCRHRREVYQCSLHHFPHKEPELSQWVKSCRRFHKLPDGTVVPWAGPGTQSAICSCHFSTPAVYSRGRKNRNTHTKYAVPDINLPDRDYIVFRGRSAAKRRSQADRDSENEAEEEDDLHSGRGSSRATPHDESVLTAMEIPNAEILSTDVMSVMSMSQTPEISNDSEPPTKRARKSTKPTARKSASKPEDAKNFEEDLFFPHDFLVDLIPWNQTCSPNKPPPELGLELVAQVCNACGYKFVFESSLRNHLSRNGLEITYVCRACPQILIFNNRCTFLNHCLMHEPLADREQMCRRAVVRMSKSMPSSKDLDLSLDPVTVGQSSTMSNVNIMRSMIPNIQLQVSPFSAFHNVTSESDNGAGRSNAIVQSTMEANDKTTDKLLASKEASPLSVHVNQTGMTNESSIIAEGSCTGVDDSKSLRCENSTVDKTETEAKIRHECPECHVSFIGYHGMTAHFGGHKRPKARYICSKCLMILSSACCLRAHLRAHTGDKPCVCFVCAVVVDHTLFERHLYEKCLAYCRQLVTDCSVCSKTMKTLNNYVEHILSEHSEMLYNCTVCTMAFGTEEACRAHTFSEHNVVHSRGCDTIFLCLLCPTLFQTKALLKDHILKVHLDNIIMRGSFQFVCQICEDKPSFTTRQDLNGHYRQHHGDRYRPNLCNECDFDGQSASRLAQHVREVHSNDSNVIGDSNAPVVAKREACAAEDDKLLPPPNICPICQYECKDKEEIYSHKYSHATFDDRFWCFVCRDIFWNKHALIQHERICTRYTDEHGELIAHSCDICPETFLDREELDSHIAKEHADDQFPCGVCGVTYASEGDLVAHTTEQHSREKRKLPFVCEVCEKRNLDKTFATVASLRRHICVAHRGRSNQVISDEQTAVTEIKTPGMSSKRLRRDGEETFTCAKCSFETIERDLFRTHIKTHKSNESDVQCPECGLNFVVLSSIRKHIVMVHRIRDVEAFMTELESNQTLQKRVEINENTLDCGVCEKHFDGVGALKIHMKTHGMAYLNMKRNGP